MLSSTPSSSATSPASTLNLTDLQKIVGIAKKAGQAILAIYEQDFSVTYKADQSPLTEADQAANAIIVQGLQTHFPHIPILSEESKTVSYDTRKTWNIFWLVDPLDGTKEFIKKNGEFTVNIALIMDGQPVAGVVHAPVLNTTYTGHATLGSAKQIGDNLPQSLPLKSLPNRSGFIVVGSRSHPSPEMSDYLEKLKQHQPNLEIQSIGSSLKLCLVAEGVADVYPRLGPTMEWDTAAAHAVIKGAGKQVTEFEQNQELTYNKETLLNPWFICQ